MGSTYSYARLVLAPFWAWRFLLAWLGPDTYGDRVADLAAGTPVEQAGAWVMQSDPASRFVADQIKPLLH